MLAAIVHLLPDRNHSSLGIYQRRSCTGMVWPSLLAAGAGSNHYGRWGATRLRPGERRSDRECRRKMAGGSQELGHDWSPATGFRIQHRYEGSRRYRFMRHSWPSHFRGWRPTHLSALFSSLPRWRPWPARTLSGRKCQWPARRLRCILPPQDHPNA